MTNKHTAKMVLAGITTLFGACGPQTPGTNGGAVPAYARPSTGPATTALGDPASINQVTITAEFTTCPKGALPARTDRSLAVSPASPDALFVGVEGKGLYRTMDGGQTWRRSVNGFKAHYDLSAKELCFDRFSSASIDAQNPNHVCVGVRGVPGRAVDNNIAAANGVYCSNDGGVSWTQTIAGNMNTAVTALLIDPSDSDTIYAGVDGNVSSDGKPYNYVGVMYLSQNRGANWTEVDVGTGFVEGMNVADFVATSTATHSVFAAIPVEKHFPLEEIIQPEHQFGIAARSQDSPYFTLLDSGMAKVQDGARITRLVGSPSAPNRLLAANAAGHQTGVPAFYVSNDNGVSFHGPSQPPHLILDGFAFDPKNGTRALGFAADSRNLWETRDGGDTWSNLGAVLPAETGGAPVVISQIAYSSDSSVIYASGSHASVYRSDNGGRSFRRILTMTDLANIGD